MASLGLSLSGLPPASKDIRGPDRARRDGGAGVQDNSSSSQTSSKVGVGGARIQSGVPLCTFAESGRRHELHLVQDEHNRECDHQTGIGCISDGPIPNPPANGNANTELSGVWLVEWKPRCTYR